MEDDDLVFRALADPTRRFLLDLLLDREGRTLSELEAEVAMSRFGVMKHLRVLEEADLVLTRKVGRAGREGEGGSSTGMRMCSIFGVA